MPTNKIFIDTETCGLYGMPVLLQYANNNDPVCLYDIWLQPIGETLRLLDHIAASDCVGFNLAFDWFHLSKLRAVFGSVPPEWVPVDHIAALATIERARHKHEAYKPRRALDLWLNACKGQYQELMNRADIRIKRIPNDLAHAARDHLETSIDLAPILFARRANHDAPRWAVYRRDDNFSDVVLKFKSSTGLKAFAEYALGKTPDATFADVAPPAAWQPVEFGYAPFDQGALGWSGVIQKHVDWWASNLHARQYARQDVEYTRDLYHHLGQPVPGDDDSELACMVAAVRWRGLSINTNKLIGLRDACTARADQFPINCNAPAAVKNYLTSGLTGAERAAYRIDSTARARLTELVATGGAIAERARLVLEARSVLKEIELYDKLLTAGRFHPSLKVGGTKSWRMSGADGLNPQGIKRTREVRECFTLSNYGHTLCGGDFESFEVVLADAVYDDVSLRRELQSGKKIHALFAQVLHPDRTYDEIIQSKGTANDLYYEGKRGVFQKIYGGSADGLAYHLGISREQALNADEKWRQKHPEITKKQQRVFESFCALRQHGGTGTAVDWKDPADYVESFLGFRRYFTLENKICRALYDLASNPKPLGGFDNGQKVRRGNRPQTKLGAARSALYAAAFDVQSQNIRAATNHEIQSPGAAITKHVQRALWDLQPAGVAPWRVAPLNVHDEVMCVTAPADVGTVAGVVHDTVEEYRERVPLISMDWQTNLNSWADK